MSSKGFKWSSHSRPWASWLQLSPTTFHPGNWTTASKLQYQLEAIESMRYLLLDQLLWKNQHDQWHPGVIQTHEEWSQSFLEILLSTWTTFYPRLSFQQSLPFMYTFRNRKVTPAAEISTSNESSSLQLLLWCSISLIRNLTSLIWCSMLS